MNLNFLKGLTSNKSCLGVDIGTSSIKMVEVQFRKSILDKPQLTNYGILETSNYLERFNTAIQASNLNLFDQEVVSYLKILLKKTGVTGRDVIASLPSFSAFTTLVEMPVMSDEDTTKTMSIHVKQYVPLPLTSVTLDWMKVGEKNDSDGNKRQQLFLIAIPTAQIENYKKIFTSVDLNLVALEIEGLSLARALAANSEETILIADIGARSTAILIVENGFLKMSQQTDFAGTTLTQSLANGLNIAPRRAEILKRQKGLSAIGMGAERELSTQLLPMLDVIINEVKRVKSNYEVSYLKPVTSVILTGGGANLLGIEKYFSQQISVPTIKADSLSRVGYSTGLESVRQELGPNLAVAIGLALRGIQ